MLPCAQVIDDKVEWICGVTHGFQRTPVCVVSCQQHSPLCNDAANIMNEIVGIFLPITTHAHLHMTERSESLTVASTLHHHGKWPEERNALMVSMTCDPTMHAIGMGPAIMHQRRTSDQLVNFYSRSPSPEPGFCKYESCPSTVCLNFALTKARHDWQWH